MENRVLVYFDNCSTAKYCVVLENNKDKKQIHQLLSVGADGVITHYAPDDPGKPKLIVARKDRETKGTPGDKEFVYELFHGLTGKRIRTFKGFDCLRENFNASIGDFSHDKREFSFIAWKNGFVAVSVTEHNLQGDMSQETEFACFDYEGRRLKIEAEDAMDIDGKMIDEAVAARQAKQTTKTTDSSKTMGGK